MQKRAHYREHVKQSTNCDNYGNFQNLFVFYLALVNYSSVMAAIKRAAVVYKKTLDGGSYIGSTKLEHENNGSVI